MTQPPLISQPLTEIRKLALYFGLGQSLMEGVSRRKQLMAPGPIAPGRALMFETGARAPRVAFDPEKRLPSQRFSELTDLQSRWSECPMTEATRRVLTALPPDEGIVTANFGRRRMRFDRIAPGADVAVYDNIRTALRHIAAAAQGIDLPISRLVISWIHGHADRNMDKGDYRRALKSLHTRFVQDFTAVVGGGARVLICASQTCTAGEQGILADPSPIANAYLMTARKHADFFILACPEYFLARTFDGVHLTPQATALLGAYHGRAIAKHLSNEDWHPLQMIGAVRDGNVVKVQFSGGTGPIVFHWDDGLGQKTWGVRNLESHGFVWHQTGGNPVHIKRLKVTGPREVTLLLSAEPRKTTAEFLSLGFVAIDTEIEGFIKGAPATGGGLATNIRTKCPDLDHFGNPLHDWALLSRVAVSRASPAPFILA